jgi:hypothetical protein
VDAETIKEMVVYFMGRTIATDFRFACDYWIELRIAEPDRTEEQRERLARKLSRDITNADGLIRKMTGFLTTNQYRADILLGMAVKANQDAKAGQAVPMKLYSLKYLVLNILLMVFRQRYLIFISPVSVRTIITAPRPTMVVSHDGSDPSCLIFNFYTDRRIGINNVGQITLANARPWKPISFHLPRRRISKPAGAVIKETGGNFTRQKHWGAFARGAGSRLNRDSSYEIHERESRFFIYSPQSSPAYL